MDNGFWDTAMSKGHIPRIIYISNNIKETQEDDYYLPDTFQTFLAH